MQHTPICPICGEYEVGTFDGCEEYCSLTCEGVAYGDEDGEQYWPGLMDDGDALASAGWGTDEDYGSYGDDAGEW